MCTWVLATETIRLTKLQLFIYVVFYRNLCRSCQPYSWPPIPALRDKVTSLATHVPGATSHFAIKKHLHTCLRAALGQHRLMTLRPQAGREWSLERTGPEGCVRTGLSGGSLDVQFQVWEARTEGFSDLCMLPTPCRGLHTGKRTHLWAELWSQTCFCVSP